jgi:carbon storage regulator
MLVLSRKPGEKVVIGEGITVTVLEVVGNRVRVGIEAPGDVRILRGELACWLEPEVSTAATTPRSPLGNRPGLEAWGPS